MFKFLNKKKKPENISGVLKYIKGLEEKIENNSKAIKELQAQSKLCLQKVGVIRYNPFSGVGSDQSFSIALLDAENNGIVLTSIYSRDGNRVYAKPIKNKVSEYALSKEEQEAIDKALNPKS